MEIIIAMAIFAIVTGALLGNFFSTISKGRDSRRKQDIELVSKALELYYNDHRAYPASLPTPTGSFKDSNNTIYMQTTPLDPRSNSGVKYYYRTDAGGTYYQLYACLENRNDPKRKTGGYAGTNCGCSIEATVNLCNYGIASLNTSP